MLLMSVNRILAGRRWRFYLVADEMTAPPEVLRLMAAEFGLDAKPPGPRGYKPMAGEVRVEGYSDDPEAIFWLEHKVRSMGGEVLHWPTTE